MKKHSTSEANWKGKNCREFVAVFPHQDGMEDFFIPPIDIQSQKTPPEVNGVFYTEPQEV